VLVDGRDGEVHFVGDLRDGLAGLEAGEGLGFFGGFDRLAVFLEELVEGADVVLFVDLLGVPEDGAIDEV